MFADQPWYEMVERTIVALYREELERQPDESGRANLMWMAREVGWDAERMRQFVRESSEWHDKHDVKPRPPIDRKVLKGAFCIPTQPRRVWWPAFLAVDEAEQDRYITETLDRRYTFGQILVSGKPYGEDYTEIQPDAGRLRAGLEKIQAAGLVTIIAVDDRQGDDLSYLHDVLVPNRDLIDWSMWIYEMNGVLKDPNRCLKVLQQGRDLLPDCLSAIHFEPLDEGRQSYGLVDFGRAQREANLNALFFQTAGWEVGVQDATNRIHDFTRRLMGGFHGYPILSHGVYDYENSTSKTYRFQMSEGDAVGFTNMLMNAPLPEDEGFAAIRPSGFCDGGTA